jgi:hypothetical protein
MGENPGIFHNNKDWNNFIERLATLLPETKASCHGSRSLTVSKGLRKINICGFNRFMKPENDMDW